MDKRGKLEVQLRDSRGASITTRSEVIITAVPSGEQICVAEGKAGEATRFVFDLPPGTCSVSAVANGYTQYTETLRIPGGQTVERTYTLAPRGKGVKASGEEDEGSIIDARILAFAYERMPSRNLVEEGLPRRQDALNQKRRMLDPAYINSLLAVSETKNPLPRSSFGDIGRWVEVKRVGKDRPSLVRIPYTKDDLGWVDPKSMRVFRVNAEKKSYELIERSGVDTANRFGFAYISRPGIYGLIGLPAHPAVRHTVDIFCRLSDRFRDANSTGIRDLQRQICQLILCSPDFEQTLDFQKFGAPIPPGGFGGNVCEFCTGVQVPPTGLPECQIPGAPPGPVVSGGCNWTSLGPRNINGRIRAMAIHPNDGATFFAGAATGGVWVTRDAGQSWSPLMRDQNSLEIGALAAHLTDPANPAGPVTIYAGTGEATWWPGYAGDGVYKSTDNGATWAATAALPAPGNRGFSVVAVDLTTVTSNPATTTVYAGGPQGLYKTTNGGGLWTQILNQPISSMVIDPVTPAKLYAGVEGQGVFVFDPVSTTWSAMNTGLTTPFPQLIQVDIGRSAPHKLYAKLDQTVYRFDTGTSTWVSLGTHGSTTYGYWNNVLAVDPQDSDIVIAGGIVLERTPDGGATWQSIGGLHGDQHCVVFDSSNHLNCYAGNDGGVYRGTYTSVTDTGTWVKVSDGLIITQFNDVGSSNVAANVLGGGSQDNGTERTVGGLTWDQIAGADGGFMVMDPANPYIIYAESQNGGLIKSGDGGASFFGAGSGFPGGPWVTPIVIDPTSPPDPNRVLFAGGSSQVYRTVNSAGAWTASSPVMSGEVQAIAIAPSSSAVVYAGTSGGQVWRSSDNGATTANWANITTGTVAGSVTLPARLVTDFAIHPTDPNIVFVGFSGFDTATPATPGHVFKGASLDGGVTWKWENITASLPDTPVNALAVRPSAPDVVFAGTDVGVFRTTDGGVSWTPFDNGLPNVVISDLELNDAGTILRVASYGRGMFQIKLDGPCTDVDVYVRDSKLDTGETFPSPSGVIDPTAAGQLVWWWMSPDIKVDAFPYYAVDALFDGVEFDGAVNEDVIRNDAGHPNPNRLYVQVHNRGPLPAHNVKVKVLYADASAGLPNLPSDFWSSFPNDWTAASSWNTVNAAVPFQTIAELKPNTPVVLRWDWTVPVTANQHTCMLLVSSADEDPVTRTDSNPNDHMVWMVVPNDKHVALRNLHVVTAPAPPGPKPFRFDIDFHNPFPYPQFFDLDMDIEGLPDGVKLSLLLPETDLRAAEVLGKKSRLAIRPAPESPVASNIKGRKDAWKYALNFDNAVADPCTGRRTPAVRRVLVPHRGKLSAAVLLTLPATVKPGAIHSLTLVQRYKDQVVGGSTYEIRIAPREVVTKA